MKSIVSQDFVAQNFSSQAPIFSNGDLHLSAFQNLNTGSNPEHDQQLVFNSQNFSSMEPMISNENFYFSASQNLNVDPNPEFVQHLVFESSYEEQIEAPQVLLNTFHHGGMAEPSISQHSFAVSMNSSVSASQQIFDFSAANNSISDFSAAFQQPEVQFPMTNFHQY